VAAQSLATARATAPVQFSVVHPSMSMPESPQAPYRYDGYGGYRYGRLTFISLFPPSFLSGLSLRVSNQTSTTKLQRNTLFLIPGRLRESSQDKPGSDLQPMGLQAKTARVIRNGREMDAPQGGAISSWYVLVKKNQWMEKLLRGAYH